MRIRIAPQARKPIWMQSWLYIAREYANDGSATRVISSITDSLGCFLPLPLPWAKGLRLGSSTKHSHFFSVNNYVIFYSVKSGEIRILRIIHTSRDAESVFAE